MLKSRNDACRQRHADVLEYILFLNLHAHILYKRMHGDTGTYQIAFMLAGKGQLFNQVCSLRAEHTLKWPAVPAPETCSCRA